MEGNTQLASRYGLTHQPSRCHDRCSRMLASMWIPLLLICMPGMQRRAYTTCRKAWSQVEVIATIPIRTPPLRHRAFNYP